MGIESDENLSSTDSSMPDFSLKSYASYVHQLAFVQPEFRWLSAFLSSSGDSPSTTQVLFGDATADNFNLTSVHPPQGASSPSFLTALASCASNVKVRLILVIYDQVWSIDREVIEALGSTFAIDPIFFWQTFDHYYAKNDRLCPKEMRDRGKFGTLWTFPLPSEHTSLEACYIDAGMNALFLGGQHGAGCESAKGASTVLVLLRDPLVCKSHFPSILRPTPSQLSKTLSDSIHPSSPSGPPPSTLASRYLAALRLLSPSQIHSANVNPAEYTYPYLHLLASEVSARLQTASFHLEQQYYEGLSARAQTDALEEAWAIVHDTRLYIQNTYKSIQTFLEPSSTTTTTTLTSPTSSGTTTSPQTAAVLRDYAALSSQIQLVQSDLRDYLNRHVGMLALLDSKKSIEQAVTMNGLTKLAFIFIPLNFVTSAFGMNLQLLGTGNAELWMFIVAALVLVGLCVGLMLLALKPPRRMRQQDPNHGAENGAGGDLLGTFAALARESWRDAFWLLVFAAENSSEDRALFCRTIRRDFMAEWRERDHNDYPSRQPSFEFPAFEHVRNAATWEQRARRMNELLTDRVPVKP